MYSRSINHMTPEKTARRKQKPDVFFSCDCCNCGNKIDVSLDGSTSSTLFERSFLIDDYLYDFTFFDCPICGNRYVIKIDLAGVTTDDGSDCISKTSCYDEPQQDLDFARKNLSAYGKIAGRHYYDPGSCLAYIVELYEIVGREIKRVSI